MKFIENTTALCQECGADKICKAHIVEKEGEEFLRTFCKQCWDSFIKIVDKDKETAKKENRIMKMLRKKVYKNVSILGIIGTLVFTLLMAFIGLKFFRMTWSLDEIFVIVSSILISLLWAWGTFRILTCSCDWEK